MTPTRPAAAGEIALPRRIDEIDAAFLTNALSRGRPGVVVRSVVHDHVIHGTGTKIRLRLEYNQAGMDHGLPRHMWLKGGFETHSDTVWNAHEHESLFFLHFAPAGVVTTPACYFAALGQGTVPGAVLIQDLLDVGAVFPDGSAPIGPEQVREGLSQMATFHGAWWGSDRLALLGTPGGSLLKDRRLEYLGQLWQECLAWPRCETIPPMLRDPAAVMPQIGAAKTRGAAAPHCLLHGDPHLGNWYVLPDGKLGLLDWQCAMRGNWVHDVNYFLIGSLSPEDRRAHERDLLAFYLSALQATGAPAPAWDDAWQAYVHQSWRGACWFLTPTTLQPETVIKAQSERFWRALEDHDLIAA